MINNVGTPSSKLQINFGVLQIDIENSATGSRCTVIGEPLLRSLSFNDIAKFVTGRNWKSLEFSLMKLQGLLGFF